MKEVIMKFEPGSKMQMHCYKHNGKIHRTWDEIIVIEDTKDYVVCANNKVNINVKAVTMDTVKTCMVAATQTIEGFTVTNG